MPAEGSPAIFLTFLVAIAGYVGMTATVVAAAFRPFPSRAWRLVAGVILSHVVMVWSIRYAWQPHLAVRNGYAGFAVFHLAAILIVVSGFAREILALPLLRAAFVVVSAGAIGATFRYEEVTIYRAPVILCALAGGGTMVWRLLRGRLHRAAPRAPTAGFRAEDSRAAPARAEGPGAGDARAEDPRAADPGAPTSR